MNILMALSQLEVTGAEVYATTLGQALADKGHQLFYVSDTLTKSHPGPFLDCVLINAIFSSGFGTLATWCI